MDPRRRHIFVPDTFSEIKHPIPLLTDRSTRGLFLAVGFCGHGFQHSYATGESVAEWLLDGRPTLDLGDLSMRRFA